MKILLILIFIFIILPYLSYLTSSPEKKKKIRKRQDEIEREEIWKRGGMGFWILQLHNGEYLSSEKAENFRSTNIKELAYIFETKEDARKAKEKLEGSKILPH